MFSNTKLRRMTKAELGKVLADMLQVAARGCMARQVGADPETATDATIALGALRMVHDIAASATERAANAVLPGYGYEVEGFCDALKDPTVLWPRSRRTRTCSSTSRARGPGSGSRGWAP